MMKLTIVAAAGAFAMLAAAASHPAKAADSDFKFYTPMPKASQQHAYTPAPATKGPATYSPYTKLPSGSVSQVSHVQSNQTNQPPRK